MTRLLALTLLLGCAAPAEPVDTDSSGASDAVRESEVGSRESESAVGSRESESESASESEVGSRESESAVGSRESASESEVGSRESESRSGEALAEIQGDLPPPECDGAVDCPDGSCLVFGDEGRCAPETSCCGDDDCAQRCESNADCPRCRPDCRAHECVMPTAPEERPECRRDSDCMVKHEHPPCAICTCSTQGGAVWSRRGWRRAVRDNRRYCESRPRVRCGRCEEREVYYSPAEAICANGQCVGHGGRLVDMRGRDPLDGLDGI